MPRKEFTPTPSHNGYPATRDPAADGRQKSPLSTMGQGNEAKFRRKYGPARVNL